MKSSFISTICVAFLLVTLVGCNNAGKQPTGDMNSQIRIIADNFDLWYNLTDNSNGYCVADLDNNGRLEIISSHFGGTGLYTHSDYYEINESFSGLTKCEHKYSDDALEYPVAEADIMDDSVDCYYDAKNNITYYLFWDNSRAGMAESYHSKVAVSFHNSQLSEKYLAYESAIATDPDSDPKTTYKDSDGNKLSKDEYDNFESDYFYGMVKKSASFGWKIFHYSEHEELKDFSHDDLVNMLTESYEQFEIK